MTAALATWGRFWFGQRTARRWGAFRVLLGLYLAGYALAGLGRVGLLYSAAGVYTPYALPDVAPSPGLALALYLGWLVAIGALILGWRVSIAAPLVLAGFLYHYALNQAVLNCTYDRLTVIFLAALCLARADEAFVWWPCKRRERVSKSDRSSFALRLVQLQMVFLYAGVGLVKLLTEDWHRPEILTSSLRGPWATDAGFWVANTMPEWIFAPAAWSIIAFELALGGLLLWRRTRFVAIALGTLFHLTIAVLLGLPQFLNCLCAYALFLEEDDLAPLARPMER